MRATNHMLEFVRTTRPWIVLMSVLGFLIALSIIVGSMGLAVSGAMYSNPETSPALPKYIGSALLLIMGLIVLYPMTRLWAAGSGLGQFLETSSTSALQAGLAQHRRFWKSLGIYTIVMMALGALMTLAFFVWLAPMMVPSK